MSLTLRFPKPASGRILLLDELKGLAILLVVLYHAGGVVAWNNRLHGELGVDIFVFLSGVGLALSSESISVGGFLRRRLLRIFPAYWAILTLVLFFNHKYFGLAYTSLDKGLHYAGIHAFFGDQYALSINDSFWFVTFVVLAYLLFLIGRRWLREPGKFVLFGAVTSLAVTLAFLHTGQAASYSHFALRLPLFFLGALWGTALKHGWIEIRPSVGLGIGCFLLTYVAYNQSVIYSDLLITPGIMAAYAFGWKRMIPHPIEGATSKVFRFLGEYSYEIYLMHQPIIRHYNIYVLGLWLKKTPNENQVIGGMVVAFLITLGLSFILRKLQLLITPARKPRVA